MKLSIIIPVYNEEKTVSELLEKVIDLKIPKVTKEIIVVDDGSTDGTVGKIPKNKVNFYQHKKNSGKGAAVVTGIKHSTGEYIIIQDADLEYDPQFIKKLVKPILEGEAKVVYGTRLDRMPNLKGEENHYRFMMHYLGNRFLSLVTSVLYGSWLTDMETCYKLFPAKFAKGIKINARSFDLEPELTAKILKAGYKIKEISIKTKPRNYDEGKKLRTFHDGSIALYTLVKYRIYD